MENSFYDLDYIISLGEKRVDLYLSAYQAVLGRLTNIILIYSAIGIYLIPIIQDLLNGAAWDYYLIAAILLGILTTSVVYTIRLLIPINVAYLEVSDRYSTNLRSQYEKRFLLEGITEEKEKEAKQKIDNYLKASYIAELSEAQVINQKVFVSKSSFYYRALIYGLAAIIPYVICIGFHLSRKDDKAQKVHLVYQKKIVNCISSNTVYA
ncbi:MAG TPA: hypothetical protein VGS79_27875 [Puia sp.]|nr:hypothetical protein [Puia sp.]